MQARTMFLTALVVGPLVGTLLGITANPTMAPPPEPSWRSARPEPIYAQPQRVVEMGPQDLSPAWYVDRTPTWKRRAAEQQTAAFVPLDTSDYPTDDRVEPQAATAEPEPAVLAEAAADQAPSRDAQTGAGAGAEAQPALVEITPAPTL